jgi:hypothetical protein
MCYMFLCRLGLHQDVIYIMNSFNFSWKVKFIKVVKVDEALHIPNGMTNHSQELYFVLMAIFSTSAFSTHIW